MPSRQFIKESNRVAKLVDQFNELAARHSELVLKTIKLEKERKTEEAVIGAIKTETKTIKAENKKKKSEYESYKTLESKTIEKMKFYGDRINRFYQQRSMKPPIELPF